MDDHDLSLSILLARDSTNLPFEYAREHVAGCLECQARIDRLVEVRNAAQPPFGRTLNDDLSRALSASGHRAQDQAHKGSSMLIEKKDDPKKLLEKKDPIDSVDPSRRC